MTAARLKLARLRVVNAYGYVCEPRFDTYLYANSSHYLGADASEEELLLSWQRIGFPSASAIQVLDKAEVPEELRRCGKVWLDAMRLNLYGAPRLGFTAEDAVRMMELGLVVP